MFLAEETAKAVSNFHGLDIFMILFTVIIAYGVIRLFKSQTKNMFALVFGSICLLTFLLIDALMIMNWIGYLDEVQTIVQKFI